MVDFRLTIAAHGNDAMGMVVKHLDDQLGIVVGWELVAWTVVQKVSEKNDTIGVLFLNCPHQTSAGIGCPMDVGSDEEFHTGSLS